MTKSAFADYQSTGYHYWVDFQTGMIISLIYSCKQVIIINCVQQSYTHKNEVGRDRCKLESSVHL